MVRLAGQGGGATGTLRMGKRGRAATPVAHNEIAGPAMRAVVEESLSPSALIQIKNPVVRARLRRKLLAMRQTARTRDMLSYLAYLDEVQS